MKTLFAAAAILVVGIGTAQADGHLASGDEITSAITGNTVQGSMIETGVYTEFYGADGTIRGEGYTGKWRVQGNTMCFDYGSDPEACWNVGIEGDQVTWIVDGKTEGTGTLVTGNPNNF